MATLYKTNLKSSGNTSFSEAMTGGFGVVTVMNVDVYDALSTAAYAELTPQLIIQNIEQNKGEIDLSTELTGVTGVDSTDEHKRSRLCRIDTLKVANATQEGPTKTITGGQYTNPLIKFGKTSRLEMQDALGNADAIEALGGAVNEWIESTDSEGKTIETYTALHVGSEFAGTKLLIGDSFIMDKKSGKQVDVKIIFYQFLPDSIFNLTQDSEGDATVFDMNGDLLTTNILIADKDGGKLTRGMFYSIVAKDQKSYEKPNWTTATPGT